MESPLLDRRQNALGMFHILSDDLVCRILSLLSPQDIGNLACVSSVFNILCNEEPLWMQLCLETHQGHLDYKGTWKQTTLAKLDLTKDIELYSKPPQQFQGFSSLFLYRRWYRCHVALEGFALDNGAVERRSNVLPLEFSASYDGKKPVLLTDLLEEWPAMKSWSLGQLVSKCGDAEFNVSQPHGKSLPMKLKSFADYMDGQHDEEPLYIFDPEFGESAPELLNDYKVPTLFSDDLFSVLSESERPPFRWLVLGPARSGASWHVDPSLTSAWNSLLSGRKRWALYPPGKVPPGVTLDINEDDGSINYDGPTSLQWWLDVYPYLDEGDKPLECTQLPGETIYVPSGWWHSVLNIDASIAVTHNFVNVNNLEIVCMDLAPGYHHRAIARAGRIALDGQTISQEPEKENIDGHLANPIFSTITKSSQPSPPITGDLEESDLILARKVKCTGGVTNPNLLLALNAVKRHSEKGQAPLGQTNEGKEMGESIMRKWLRSLWVARPELQQTIWKVSTMLTFQLMKNLCFGSALPLFSDVSDSVVQPNLSPKFGACVAFDAGTWLHRIKVICNTFGFSWPADQEQLPVGDGTNPVYLVGDYAIKLYVQEAEPAALIDGLGSELNFYSLLKESGSSFREVVPELIASGILYLDGEDYQAVHWDGTGDCSLVYPKEMTVGKKRCRDSTRITTHRFRTKWSANAIISKTDGMGPVKEAQLWPYLVTKRCSGRMLSEVRKNMSQSNLQSLATFLGKQVHVLHTVPLPTLEQTEWNNDHCERSCTTDDISEEQLRCRNSKEAKYDTESSFMDESSSQPGPWICPTPITLVNTNGPEVDTAVDMHWEVPKVWDLYVSYLRKLHKTACERHQQWGSLPDHLLKQVETFLPKDPVVLVGDVQVLKGMANISGLPVWLHMDMFMENILVEELGVSSVESEVNTSDAADQQQTEPTGLKRDSVIQPRYILDYGDLLYGDPLYDLLPIYVDVFGLEGSLLETFLRSYQLPFSISSKMGVRLLKEGEGPEGNRQHRLSYCAMCYCLLHELDMMAAIFKVRHDIRTASSFEEIEDKIWGSLNKYRPEN